MTERFIKKYEAALATQKWINIDPLICETASVTFSDGTVHIGKSKIKAAFERNFSIIKSEKYSIENVHWLRKEEYFAVYLFKFSWTGIISGKEISGKGIGTSTIINENGQWKLLAEHLGQPPK